MRPRRRFTPAAWVAAGGLIAGTCDIAYACAFWWVKRGSPPQRIFQSVAAGLLGDASFQGGWQTAGLGLVLHYFIALSMCTAYFLVARKWALLTERPFVVGGLYGLFLFGTMNGIVVPLSAARLGPKDPVWILASIAVHMFLIGIPIALAVRRAARASDAPVAEVHPAL